MTIELGVLAIEQDAVFGWRIDLIQFLGFSHGSGLSLS